MKSTEPQFASSQKTYNINEIFYSLQGEGFFTGTPCVFLRFSGCNRKCPFCDTDFSSCRPMTAAQIIDQLLKFPSRQVVATGGEPLLQLDHALIDAIHQAGFSVAVETNGSLPVDEAIDWVTCSPKQPPLKIQRIDELKIVYDGTDPEMIAASLPPARHRFLQPLSCSNTQAVVEYILAHPSWRLSLQTHKLINIP